MWNTAYTQRKILSVLMKKYPIQTFTFNISKVVYFSVAHISSAALLENEVSTSIKCTVWPPDNWAGSRSNSEATP